MDKYDVAIEELIQDPFSLFDEWCNAACLFDFASPDPDATLRRPDGAICGCLTQVCSGESVAWTDALTIEIRQDARIPEDVDAFASEFPGMSEDEQHSALQPFAEWQRRLNVEIRGLTPGGEKPNG
jgi:hypothetical protein